MFASLCIIMQAVILPLYGFEQKAHQFNEAIIMYAGHKSILMGHFRNHFEQICRHL